MNELNDEMLPDFEFSINPEAPLFVISVVSEMVQIPIWTLRKLDEYGIIKAERKGKKTRCYSKIQIKKLYHIHYLMNVKKVNISGIKHIFEIEYRKEGENG
ncbi:MAG: MerR family transcriptional regulator [Candidatus Omnitrophica bacterium]|nr:MerR family transcriptional regulator [Candidatus Omnitrophota bacterium]MCB9747359.1 MerR family transcriptional regulator [Candidatus Omnitrophota bacterium]